MKSPWRIFTTSPRLLAHFELISDPRINRGICFSKGGKDLWGGFSTSYLEDVGRNLNRDYMQPDALLKHSFKSAVAHEAIKSRDQI
jgi:hypothetical protein